MRDRKSTRLNSSHTEIYTLSLHDALPISHRSDRREVLVTGGLRLRSCLSTQTKAAGIGGRANERSEEHTSELQSHRDLHSFPTRRSSDLSSLRPPRGPRNWWASFKVMPIHTDQGSRNRR